MKKSLKRPGWTRSKPFRNFMAGCLASSLAVPLFVLADPSSDAPADRVPANDESPAVTDSPESLPTEEVAEEVTGEVTDSEPEPTLEEQREEYLTELGEQEYSCSRDIERARRDVKAHRNLFKDADQFAEVLSALDEEELKIYAQKVEEAESLDELSELAEDRRIRGRSLRADQEGKACTRFVKPLRRPQYTRRIGQHPFRLPRACTEAREATSPCRQPFPHHGTQAAPGRSNRKPGTG